MSNKANADMVSKAEHNQLKRKLELEIQKGRKQMKLMEALIAKSCFPSRFYILFSIFPFFTAKRTRICLTVPDFAKAMEEMKAMDYSAEPFSIFSDPVDVAGFEWKLEAFGSSILFRFFLHASPPAEHDEGSFEFEVD